MVRQLQAVGVALTLASTASAADELALRPAIDGPVLATTAAYSVLTLYLLPDRPPVVQQVRPPEGFDVGVAGQPALEGAVPLASDLLAYGGVGIGLVAAPLYGAGASGPGGGRGALTHGIVYAQTISTTVALTDVLKTASRRPRPYTHAPGFEVADIDDQMSFPSGHSSTAGAASFGLVHPIVMTSDLPTGAVLGLYGAATAWTASTAALRVVAHKHYPSDVIMGSLLGASMGIVVPELHRASRMQLSVSSRRGTHELRVSGLW
jgi:membrane-associated phospholipid phosphatase